ncbi:ATP-binding protein [Streptomyces sp. NK15101]|uniref:ATP-binding protein n=1 Tax=Streptomyces sp. NK15101 TaxID=2873261 RepID=UPI001CEC9E94|nr:ATP-binding protein [Streptomyces sp. NK15101]
MAINETTTTRKEDWEEGDVLTAATTRDKVRRFLDERFCRERPTVNEDVVLADALLVATELVTNANRHGGGVRAFKLLLADEGLWITVTDRNRAWPTVTAALSGMRAPRPGGLGLLIVRRLSKELTITPAPGGKTIHALVPLN